MRWDRISVLLDRMEEDLSRQGYVTCMNCGNAFLTYMCRYFHLDARRPEPLHLQQGTVRTNCMDNLDRTNVAQAAFAKWTLNQQLRELGIMNENESIDKYEELIKDFRESELHVSPLVAARHGSLTMDTHQCGPITQMRSLSPIAVPVH